MSLDKEALLKLLEEDAKAPKRGGGGRTKVDPTTDRTLPTWYKLNHHLCTRECPHRADPANPTKVAEAGHACWNPNCHDPRDKTSDQSGASIVVEVKGQWICRYCFMEGYLL